MNQIKPCPFCGRIPVVDDCGDHRYFVRCKCGINQDHLYYQKCDAIKAWNRRWNDTQEPTQTTQSQHVESVGEYGSALKHGHWIDRDDELIAGTCSVCGWNAIYYETDVCGMPYCPNCGAKMDEDELQEPEINPCRGCDDYDGQGGCKSNGGCGVDLLLAKHEDIGYEQGFRDGYAEALEVTDEDEPIRHGRWIISEDRYWKTCSECGAEVDVSMGLDIFVDGIRVDEMDYCPCCGAKMDKRREDGKVD